MLYIIFPKNRYLEKRSVALKSFSGTVMVEQDCLLDTNDEKVCFPLQAIVKEYLRH